MDLDLHPRAQGHKEYLLDSFFSQTCIDEENLLLLCGTGVNKFNESHSILLHTS